MSAKIYLALAGGLLVGALMLGNPFLAQPAYGSAGPVGDTGRGPTLDGVASDSQPAVVPAGRSTGLEVEAVELAGESFAVVTRQEGVDGRCLLVLEDGRVVTKAEGADEGFRVVELGTSLLPRRIESSELRAPRLAGDPDERR